MRGEDLMESGTLPALLEPWTDPVQGILTAWCCDEARVCAKQATFRRVFFYGMIKLRLSSRGG